MADVGAQTKAKAKPAAQLDTLRRSFEWVSDWSMAIDGGANVGDWTDVMSGCFAHVMAFEPSPDLAGLLTDRFWRSRRVEVRPQALLDRFCTVMVRQSEKRTSHRSRYVEPAAEGTIRALPIDALGLGSCGLIKLDLEGAEYLALRGAVETVERCRPVLIVEIDGHGRRFGVDPSQVLRFITKRLGYKRVYESRPDQVFVPK